MRYKDIEKATGKGKWETNYSMKSLVDQIEGFIRGEDCNIPLLMNPDFQRGHVWTEEQQIKFVEAVLAERAPNAMVIYLNDSLWSDSENQYREFVCVDGLQRYTAIKRFIKNEIPAYDCLYKDYEDRHIIDRTLRTLRLNINNLETKAKVVGWYLEMNEGGIPHSEEELARVRKMLEGIGDKNE